jgi:alkyl hydroperoxide reductase subunit AhpC
LPSPGRREFGLSYPLPSDIHRTTCQACGIHDVERICAKRSIFIVDKQGVLRFKEAFGPGQLPDPERLLPLVRGLGE